jgi:hypothetical protein
MATAKKTTTPAAKTTAVVLKDVYVAFSIHGTNTFITATMKSQTPDQIEEILDSHQSMNKFSTESMFKIDKSRRPGFDSKKEVKLSFSLLNNKDGTPTKSKTKVMQAFKELEDMGWTVDKEEFVRKHWPSK